MRLRSSEVRQCGGLAVFFVLDIIGLKHLFNYMDSSN